MRITSLNNSDISHSPTHTYTHTRTRTNTHIYRIQKHAPTHIQNTEYTPTHLQSHIRASTHFCMCTHHAYTLINTKLCIHNTYAIHTLTHYTHTYKYTLHIIILYYIIF